MLIRTCVAAALAVSLASACGKKKDDAVSSASTTEKGSGEKSDKTKPEEDEKADKDEKAEKTDEKVEPKPPEKRKAVAVAAGESAACAIMDNGTVRCWGRSDYGELGVGKNETDAASPVEVEGVKDAVTIVMGGDPGDQGDSVCVRTKAGAWWCWGYSRMFPGMNNETTGKAKEMAALKDALQLSIGGGTGCAVWADGKAKCWGGGYFGKLGDGTNNDQADPTLVPGLENVAQVSVGQNHACALIKDGTVKCWGYIGQNQNVVPTAVTGLANAEEVVAMMGGADSCARTKDKKVVCWRDLEKVEPVEGIDNATALGGRTHWCAVRADGNLACWGWNDRGQLGTGNTDTAYQPQNVADVAGTVSVGVGREITCAALTDGGVKCWGMNQRGQLGDGTLVDRLKPTAVVGLTEVSLPATKDGLAEVTEHQVVQAFDGLPPECVKEPSLKLAYSRFEGQDFPVKSAYAWVEWEGKQVTFELANYNVNPERNWDRPRGKQMKISVQLMKQDLANNRTPVAVDMGVYSMDVEQERMTYVTIHDRAQRQGIADWNLRGPEAGSIELKFLNDAWLCGTLAVKTSDTSIAGNFVARRVK